MDTPKFTSEYEDILQNIEFSIIHIHRNLPLVDSNVMEALETLITTFKHIDQGREPQDPNLSDKARLIYAAVLDVCTWRMGENVRPDILGKLPDDCRLYSGTEIVACLKRVLKSVNKWNKNYGRQGYLHFIGEYLP